MNVAEKVFSAHQMGVGVVIQDADGEVLVAFLVRNLMKERMGFGK